MDKDLELIIDNVRKRYEAKTGVRSAGHVEGLLNAVACHLNNYIHILENRIIREFFIATSSLDSLKSLAADWVKYKEGKKANASVYIYGSDGRIVNAGDEVKDAHSNVYIFTKMTVLNTIDISSVNERLTLNASGTVEFDTSIYDFHDLPAAEIIIGGLKKNAIRNGTKLEFDSDGLLEIDDTGTQVFKKNLKFETTLGKNIIEATEHGTLQPLSNNDDLEFVIERPGVNKIIKVVSFENGHLEQDIEDYRNEIRLFLQFPQAPFTVNEIKRLLFKNVEFLRFVHIEYDKTTDKYSLLCFDKNYLLPDETKNIIIDVLTPFLPVNVDINDINIGLPAFNNIQLTITDISPLNESLYEDIKNNLVNYFAKNIFNQDINKTELEKIIYLSSSGSESPNVGFNLATSNLANTGKTLHRLIAVSINGNQMTL